MLDTTALLAELNATTSPEATQARYEKVLGKNGLLTLAFRDLKALSDDEKKTQGQLLSDAKTTLTPAYEALVRSYQAAAINQKLLSDPVDISIESAAASQGYLSLLTQTRRKMEDICQSLGFQIEYGDDVVTKYENFEAVNIPLSHPATEMHDTFYLNHTDPQGQNYVFRTHTSAMQNRLLKTYGAPLRVVIPGRVYRYENMDATHDTVFYQLEGVIIDKHIGIAHFKALIEEFLSALFGDKIETRLRPSYFPFVEPGFEIDAKTASGLGGKSGRVEIMGAGMIHPKVLSEGGLNPDEYSGFAFGIGVNRVVGLLNNIHDIRLLTNGDVRFAQSFK